MNRKRFDKVVVLKGGASAEREVSLASGAAVANGLRACGYDVSEVDVQGEDLRLEAGIEAAFIALHGSFGEDGRVQSRLREMGIPYTGSGPEASRLAFDKHTTKRILEEHGIPTPAYEMLRRGQPRSLSLPVVVKPPLQGSTIGIHRVFGEDEWNAAFEDAVQYDEEILVEAYIEGAELTVGVVCDEVMPIVEIRAPDGYYDFAAKYTKGASEYLVPAPLSREQTEVCQAIGLQTYNVLGCRGLARVDLRLTPSGEPYVLELNSIPGFTETSLLPMSARSAGIEFPQLCDRILQSASL